MTDFVTIKVSRTTGSCELSFIDSPRRQRYPATSRARLQRLPYRAQDIGYVCGVVSVRNYELWRYISLSDVSAGPTKAHCHIFKPISHSITAQAGELVPISL
jgi:hypothetical protein